MDRKELIKNYLDFFKSKNHKEIPNASLIPKEDPSVLFTTAGMHPLAPYLLGQKHPLGRRLCNVQRCIRTTDIDEVGDNCHHTFFEMLGNWSLGDYWKKDALQYSFDFLTKILKIPKERLAVSVFSGDKNAKKDEESAKIWNSLGIKKIKFFGKKDNWWGPAGETGPCGPDTEIFVNEIEIWNDVFMEYEKTKEGKYKPLKQKNVDTGMGVERVLAVLNKKEDNYETHVFKPVIEKIEMLSLHKYNESEEIKRSIRIIADHIRAAIFLINDGITPGNSEQGYVLRKLIRRAIRYGRVLGIERFVSQVAEPFFLIYKDYKFDENKIVIELGTEEERFLKTLQQGLVVFEKISMNKRISGEEAFLLYQSFGFPIEITRDLCREKKIKLDEKDFEKEVQKHQKLSRTASAGKFKSGLADSSKETTKLHTAAHLLLQALKIILKDNSIIQKGSNITAERLRLDFSFTRKLTEEEIKKVEDLVNSQIQNSCEVIREEMSLEQARKKGACGIFDKKYGNRVSVYSIGNFSKEICTGPHVKNTCELGKFKITKEESSSSGVRRIKAILR